MITPEMIPDLTRVARVVAPKLNKRVKDRDLLQIVADEIKASPAMSKYDKSSEISNFILIKAKHLARR
jgi:hypothetical protein